MENTEKNSMVVSKELKSTQVCYGEDVLMMRVDDCLIFGNKDALQKLAKKLEGWMEEVIEQKKGKWQRRKGSDCWECSECHAVLENSDVGNHNFYYCYHCGADMMDKSGYMDIEEVHYG